MVAVHPPRSLWLPRPIKAKVWRSAGGSQLLSGLQEQPLSHSPTLPDAAVWQPGVELSQTTPVLRVPLWCWRQLGGLVIPGWIWFGPRSSCWRATATQEVSSRCSLCHVCLSLAVRLPVDPEVKGAEVRSRGATSECIMSWEEEVWMVEGKAEPLLPLFLLLLLLDCTLVLVWRLLDPPGGSGSYHPSGFCSPPGRPLLSPGTSTWWGGDPGLTSHGALNQLACTWAAGQSTKPKYLLSFATVQV